MKAEEIKAMVCENIVDGTRIWAFIRNGNKLGRINIGFDTMEVLGMASLATQEICQLIGGDKSLSPTPIERKAVGFDDDEKEAQLAN